MENIIGQVFGIAATVITFISYQMNTKKTLLITQSLATVCTCLSFLFLGAATGFALNVVCLIRNGVFYLVDLKSKLYYPSVVVLTIAMVCVGALSWQGWLSLLVIIALAVNTVFLSLGNPQMLRKSIPVTSTMVLIYNVSVFSIGGIVSEAISIVSSVIGLIRYKKKDDSVASTKGQ